MVPKYVILMSLGALAVASSCQSDGAASPLALYPGNAEGHEALLQGTLERVGRCFYISGKGGERWLAAFPSPGTTWDSAAQSVQVAGKTCRVGAAAGFTGGEIRNGLQSVQWVRAPDKECDGSKIWLVTAVTDS